MTKLAEDLRSFRPIGLLAVLVIFAGNLLFLPLSAILVLVWAHLSQTPLEAIGFARPRWARVIAIGIPAGALLKLVMKALVMPLLGAPEINPRYHYIAGNTAALPSVLYAVLIGASFGEETVFRGFLFERLGKLLGTRTGAMTVIVLVSSALFAIAHYPDQGLPGVEQAAMMGLVFGTMYAVTRRLWLPMVTHAAFDLTAVALIYWNWEPTVAHFLFR